MKLTVIILICAMVQVSAATFGQSLTLHQQNTTLKQVFQEIKKQTGYRVLYADKQINTAKRLNVNFNNTPLKEVLDRCLIDQELSYIIEDESIVINEKTPSFFDRVADQVNVYLNNIDARGRILDESGKPLEGATIILKGTNRTAKTDVKGEFVLANVPDDGVLVIRYVGYKQLEISLKDAVMPLEIKLNVSTGELEEVKVVYNTGYQQLNKERATGSFVHIDNEMFNRSVGPNVLDRIKNLVPGIYSTARSLTTNPLDDFTIRGVSTINASKRPLLVVDNFIYDGNPNTINPYDVESVTVLRDAAAASIWGVRAGNGVIVITMKKGKLNSRPVVSLNSNFSFTEKPDLFAIPIVPSRDLVSLEKQRFDKGFYNSAINSITSYPAISQVAEILAAKRAGRISALDADMQLALLENQDVRNDINRYLTQIPTAQQYALNISGGGTVYQYSGSVGYNRSRPEDVNKLNEALSLRFSNIWQPLKNLQLNMELTWSQANNNNKNSLGNYRSILNTPYHILANEQGNAMPIPMKYRMAYVDTVKFVGQLDWHYRPLDEASNGDERLQSYNTVINGGLSYAFIPGLKADIRYQWQKANGNTIGIRSLNTFYTRDLINRFIAVGANGLPNYPYPLGGVYDRAGNDQKAWSVRGQLNFDKNFGVHQISAILGLETRESTSGSWTVSPQYGYNSQTNTFGVPQQGSWVTRPAKNAQIIAVAPGNVFGNLNRFGSWYGNMGYTFMEKYTLTGSARIDQSNFFGVKVNDRKVPLWSAGLGWQISKEDFYKIDWLPTLGLRATYGYNGNVNAGTSPFATASYANPIAPTFLPFARISTPPNPQLRWERVRNVNLALDFGTKDQRITGNIEFFKKKGIDLLSDIDIDATSGFTTYRGNQSSVQTHGFDLSITGRNFDGVLKWYTTAIFAYQQNKVIAYTVPPPVQGLLESSTLIGKPFGSLYAYRWAGLNPLNGSAQFYLKDQVLEATQANIDKIKQEDLVYIGQSSPPIFGAFRNDLNFKNISLSFNISYQFGHYFRRQSFNGSFGSATTPALWQHKDYLQVWKAPGDEMNTNVPGFLDAYPDSRYHVYENADILIEKGDHIRLQDIRLNYAMNKSTIKTLPFTNASFYIYLNNIGIIWKASKYSPDTQGGLLSPSVRSLSVGLNVNF